MLASASPTATILDHDLPFAYEKSANGYRLKTPLSHAWGSVQNLLTTKVQMTLRNTIDAPVSPVVDHTGIVGKFDFHLDVETPPQSPSDPGDNPDNVSDAMQNQLGLKLNRIKVPMEVLVIDHLDREPAAN